MRKEFLGEATVSPREEIIAGSCGSWEIVYKVGKYGIDDGGSIILASRAACDREIPQTKNPSGSGYVTAVTDGKAKLKVHYDGNYYIRPWKGALVIHVVDGFLRENDRVVIFYGDTTQGSPGLRAQTFAEKEHTFKVLVDPFGTGKFYEIEKSPTLSIVGGPANQLQVVAPSYVSAGKPFSVLVRALDSWGNPSYSYRETVEFQGLSNEVDLPEKYTFESEDRGAKRFSKIKLFKKGIYYIKIKDGQKKTAISDPLICHSEKPDLKIYWGDLHGQTRSTLGTGTVQEYFRFARDVSGLDFCGWQGNDFQVTKKGWEEVKKQVKLFNEPGRFITLLGYEWSGLTPAGGDHNIYFLKDDEEIYRSSHALIDDKSDIETDRYPLWEIWKTFEGMKDVMAVPHVGGRYANFDFYDPRFIPLIEIYSQQGSFEWFAEGAIKRNLKVGFIAGSDDHTGRPGLTFPTRRVSSGRSPFGVKGGYAAVYAKELTRKSLWDAFWKRHCYATTGERIILSFKADEDKIMGDEYLAERAPKLSLEVLGTDSLLEVEIKRGLETIYRYPTPAQLKQQVDKLIKIEWSGARVKTRSKETCWDGGLTIKDGKILSFQEFAFDQPDHGIIQISNQHLEWKSTTLGDPDGVLLNLDASEDTTITFYSKPKTFSFMLKEINNEPKIVKARGFNQKIKISLLPSKKGSTTLNVDHTDENMKEGLNVYWVRVLQYNGAMAWSSPIFVNYGEKIDCYEIAGKNI